MSKKLKVAVIGCGGIAVNKHLPALVKLEEVELVAFCDIVEERAEKAAKEYGTAESKVYTDFRKLLSETDVEVVHVCTPNDSHAEITVASLNPADMLCVRSRWLRPLSKRDKCWMRRSVPAKS